MRYDNFRHLFFTLPGLFLLTSFAWETILCKLRSWWQKFIFVLALILPGVIPIFYLYPYQYVYYNSLIGYTGGALRRYEMDYWLTSFREAAEYLNEHAGYGAKILTWEGGHILAQYTRPDLVIEEEHLDAAQAYSSYDYAVLTTRYEHDSLYPEGKIVMEVQRSKALFAIIRQFSAPAEP